MSDQLNDLLGVCTHLANKDLRNKNVVRSAVIYETADGERHKISYDPNSTATGRELQAVQIGSEMRQAGAVAYCVFHEVWIAEYEKDQPMTERPSQHAGRIDAAAVVAYDKGTAEGRVFRIERSTRPYGLVELPDMSGPWSGPQDIWRGLLSVE